MVSPKMSGTEARLRAVLDTNRSRDSLSPRRRAAALLFAALIAAPLAVLAPVSGAGAQQDQQAPAAPARTGKPVPRTAGGFTQTISKDFLRAVSPGRNGSAGRVIEFDRAARDKAPARIVNGSRATLPNGYVVEVIGLNRLAARDGYWQSADPQAWQKPDGTLFKLPVLPHSTYQSGMPTDRTRGLAPVLVVTRITPPPGARRSGFSSVIQPLGTAQDVEYSWIVPHTRVFGPEDTVVNSFTYPLFPEDAKTFALKAGIATGPWTTRAVKPISFSPKTTGKISGAKSDREFRLLIKLDDSPAIEYVDRRGHWHADYFLPRGTRLGAEDRRVVAVDARGKTFPLEFGSLSGGLHQFGAPMSALSFSPSSDRRSPYHSPIGLAAVRELRLETRPFQRVEFRNLAIPPQTQAADTVTKAPDTATQAAPPVTVVIDAGHGGADSGATAKNAREKDINLAVARRLRDELAAAGIRVVMTRIDDTFIPITTRGDLAAREKAACFISIHCEPTGPNYSVSYHDNSSSGKRFADSIARQNAQAFGPASGKISSDTIRFANGYGILRKSSPVSAAVLVSCPGVAQMTSPEAQNRAARSFAAGIRDFVTSAH
jgi:N-acetylmuramoyl-L-alanine amidase